MAEPVDLAEIGRDRCLRLLAGGVLGRVVFSAAAMPAAQLVTYVLDRGEIVFRAAAGSGLATATRRAVVAFEADDIDRDALTGWSVLGVGETYEVTDPVRLAGLAAAPQAVWDIVGPALTIAIRLQQLTGRSLDSTPAPRVHGGATA